MCIAEDTKALKDTGAVVLTRYCSQIFDCYSYVIFHLHWRLISVFILMMIIKTKTGFSFFSL